VQFRGLLRGLGQRASVVVSTHLVEDVGAACTEVALMDQGKIVFRGTPQELTTRGEGRGTGDAPLERGYTLRYWRRREHDRRQRRGAGTSAARRPVLPWLSGAAHAPGAAP
jgi:ABC-type multidrug transport system ATPase subunit